MREGLPGLKKKSKIYLDGLKPEILGPKIGKFFQGSASSSNFFNFYKKILMLISKNVQKLF